MKNNVILKFLEINDIEKYIEFRLKLANETEYTMNLYPEEVETDKEIIADKLVKISESDSKGFTKVLYYENEIIGYIVAGEMENKLKSKHRAYFGIAVLNKYQGKGYGSLLMQDLLKVSKEKGFTQLELEVIYGNDKAYSLYKKYGFIEYGNRQNTMVLKNGEILGSILMYKEL